MEKISIIASAKSLEHNPPFDVWHGIPEKHYDTPQRASCLLDASKTLSLRGLAEISTPNQFSRKDLETIHLPEYLDFIKSVSEKMADLPEMWVPMITNYKTGEVICYKHPAWHLPCDTPHGINPKARDLLSQAGRYSFDQSTPIMANTYEVVLESAFSAMTAAQKILDGNNLAYSLCRPPGHHAEPSRSGGYCYLNNAALAAEYLRTRTNKHVSILDIDAHHGNGTELSFYSTSEISYSSIHVDSTHFAPHYTGHTDSVGVGDGTGYNHNYPLEVGTNESRYLATFSKALHKIKEHSPSYLIVSLGFDSHDKDPLSIFKLSDSAFEYMAKELSEIKIPTLVVQEGGYNVEHMGGLLSIFLENLVK